MRQFSVTAEIAAPQERVWSVMIDVTRWHEWTPSVRAISRLDEGPFAVGSKAVIRQPRFPPALWTVAAIDQEGRSFEWTSVGPGIRVVGRHSVEPTGPGSRATLSLEYQGLLGGVMGWMTKAITERYLALEARGLKARSEDPAFRHDGNVKGTRD